MADMTTPTASPEERIAELASELKAARALHESEMKRVDGLLNNYEQTNASLRAELERMKAVVDAARRDIKIIATWRDVAINSAIDSGRSKPSAQELLDSITAWAENAIDAEGKQTAMITDIEARLREVTDEEWQTLLDKDDRNSPSEYPDMCLITRDEVGSIIRAAEARYADTIAELKAKVEKLDKKVTALCVSRAEKAENNMRLRAQLAEAREALELILPLAKGYGDLHRVGSNAAYVECAAEVLRKMEKANG